jgi:DnaK suppressor protein
MLIWVEEGLMDTKKIKGARRLLSSEYENVVKWIHRNRTATEETKLDNTEDEGDLATTSRERQLLYHLHESNFTRLRYIQQAMKAIDRGQYGDCVRCGESINERRLDAVPWTRVCVHCQEETEAERTSSLLGLAGLAAEEMDS